jgi:hypothetical protein
MAKKMATALSEIGLTFWSVWCFRRSFDVAGKGVQQANDGIPARWTLTP